MKICPFPEEGTLTAADRQDIWEKTQCSASVRPRAKMPRSLTVSGPVSQLEAAHKLAKAAIEKNKRLLDEGQSLPAAGGEFKGSEDRKEAGRARRALWEMQAGSGSAGSQDAPSSGSSLAAEPMGACSSLAALAAEPMGAGSSLELERGQG